MIRFFLFKFLLNTLFTVLFFNLFLKSLHINTFVKTLLTFYLLFQNSNVSVYFSLKPIFLLSNLIAPMASSSAHSENIQSEQYIVPERTTLIPVDNLEVISEIMVDFENLKANGFDLLPTVEFQG